VSTDRDVTRIVRSWLEEGATALPDRVLDAVLDQLPATSQRRARWPARRLNEMNSALKLALAAAAVVVVAVVGINLAPRSGDVGGTGQSPTPTQTPSPTLTPTSTSTSAPSAASKFPQLPIGDLVAGTSYFINDPCCTGPARIVLTVPAAGWFTVDTVFLGKKVPGDPDTLFGITLGASKVGNLWRDPCHRDGTGAALNPPVGPTVDDLANALAVQGGADALPPTDVRIGGYPAKKVELSVPAGLKTATCDGGDFGWWSPPDDVTGAAPYTFGDGQHATVYVFEVSGTRQVIQTTYLPGTPGTDLAELQAIVDSIKIEP